MRYLEATPHPSLRPAVVCHWTITSAEGPAAPIRHSVYPDGCFDLLFALHGAVGAHPARRSLSGAYVVGPMTRPAIVEFGESTDLVGIRFRPGVASRMIGVPLVELRDAMVPARDLLGIRADELTERLASSNVFAWRRSLLDTTMRSWLDRSAVDAGAMPLAGLCFERVERVPELADRFGISQRQVQRLFLRDVGLTPTEVVRLHRFRRAMDRLRTARPRSLSALAFELGYSDHAHFTREFAAFAGVPPTAFMRHGAADGVASDLFKRATPGGVILPADANRIRVP